MYIHMRALTKDSCHSFYLTFYLAVTDSIVCYVPYRTACGGGQDLVTVHSSPSYMYMYSHPQHSPLITHTITAPLLFCLFHHTSLPPSSLLSLPLSLPPFPIFPPSLPPSLSLAAGIYMVSNMQTGGGSSSGTNMGTSAGTTGRPTNGPAGPAGGIHNTFTLLHYREAVARVCVCVCVCVCVDAAK